MENSISGNLLENERMSFDLENPNWIKVWQKLKMERYKQKIGKLLESDCLSNLNKFLNFIYKDVLINRVEVIATEYHVVQTIK